MVGGCCVCSDERGWPENPLVYCDGQGCTVAVHQACYGIVTVPTGPWYCRKCESQERSARVRCELCPSKDGALKRTDNSGWAHVVCALYIPEVRFGNVTTMEPIILQLIPTERFNKVCYICEELGKGSRSTVGACMQCNKSGCKQQFHVTCAQALGLLCEEAGNYLDNVKYCGYCQHHYSKLKKGGNVKTIPPYKPIPTDHHSSDSSPEKDAEANTLINKNSQQQSTSSSSSSSKRKSSSSTSKSSSSSSKSSSSASKSTSSSTSSHQKTVHNSSSSNKSVSNAEKSSSSSKGFSSSSSSNVKSVKNTDSHSELSNTVNSHHTDSDLKVTEKVANNKDLTASGQKFANCSYGGDSAAVPSSVVNDTVYGAASSGEVRNDSNLSVNSTATSKESSSSSSSSKSSSKKRKAGSRTPTPNSIGHSAVDGTTVVDKNGGVSTIVSVSQSASGIVNVSGSGQNSSSTVIGTGATDRRDSIGSVDAVEKPKKAKTEHIPPSVAPPSSVTAAAVTASHITTSTSSRTTSSPSVIANEHPASTSSSAVPNDISVHSTGHTTTHSTSGLPASSHVHHQSHHSVHVNNNAHVSGSTVQPAQPPQPPPRPPSSQHYHHHVDRNDRGKPVPTVPKNGIDDPNMCISTSLDSTMVSSETSDGLKITYEKQPTMNSSSLSRLALDAAPVVVEEAPAKRSRSQSADKTEKMGRPKKRGSNGVTTVSGPATGAGKRTSRSQHPTPPPAPTIQPGAFSSVSQQIVKESPPSSPSDENNSVGSVRRTKGRKSAPATVTSVPSSSSSTTSSGKPDTKETKDIKVDYSFQNGVHAPHMLGNQLNPNSNMAQKMSDHLNSELEAHSIFNAAENNTSNLVGPQLHSRVIASIRSTNSTTSASNSSSGFSSMLGGGSGGAVPQTLDQLLERQWEQGSQFLMEQAQHFDIASLLSCLHQLRAENLRLEEHVNSLLQRRDHLLAVNARLAIPLTNQQPVAAPSQPHTINNLHPSVTASHGDVPRSRHSSSAGYPTHTGAGAPPLENGLPSDGAAYPHQHRSPANAQPQPSPTIRHSPAAGAYPSTSNHGVVRTGSASESSGRSSQRPQSQSHPSYAQYQGQVPVVTAQQQPQMVIRRDSDVHHQMPSSKPS
ncbi:Alhambra [Carabus blaptoides fortunei]